MVQRVLIADDEPLARERLRELVRSVDARIEIREVGDGPSAIDALLDWKPDALFLDIQMPGCDGFAVVESVGAGELPPTVFVTAFDAHALRAFDVAAVDYLLKPFDDARFGRAWERLQQRRSVADFSAGADTLQALLDAVRGHAPAEPVFAERFLARVRDRTVPVATRDILWIRSDGNYVDLFTSAGAHTIRETLSQVEARLDPARFMRIHRRVIVRLDQIRELQPWFAGDQVLILKDGTKLRVSRTYRAALIKRLHG